jgi:epsilon-lactone hydrolase
VTNELRLGERVIPIPRSVSPEARAALARGRGAAVPLPALHDKPAWKSHIIQFNAATAAELRDPIMALPVRATLDKVGGVPVYVAEPERMPAENRDKVFLYFHGGGLVLLGGECVGLFARLEAANSRSKVYAVDYRNPPDHPYPAALEDCLAVYRALLETHGSGRIVVMGVSGGGNLAAAMPLMARDLGLPLPAAIGLFTPEIDLTESGDTFQTNRDIDTVLPRGLPELNALYADGHDLAHPYLSPLFGDFAKGFPPTFIQSGTRDLFLSNSVRMHRVLCRAGVETELHVGEAMPHGGFGNAPEDLELRVAFLDFLAKFAGWA